MLLPIITNMVMMAMMVMMRMKDSLGARRGSSVASRTKSVIIGGNAMLTAGFSVSLEGQP